MKMRRLFPESRLSLLAFLILIAASPTAVAQGTAFTYQGRLNDGASAANGIYDLRFAVYDSTNQPGSLVGGPITNSAVTVSNGLFTVAVDFGAAVFTGADRWLQVSVGTNGTATFSDLLPRQQIAATPYSVLSGNAAVATVAASANSVLAANISGTIPPTQLPPGVVTNGASGLNIAGTFTGSGAGLSNVMFSAVVPTTNSTIAAWGYSVDGETNVPPGLNDIMTVAAGGFHSVALRANGALVAWGRNDYGQTNVPPGLSNVIAVAAGAYHTLALKADGTVVAWGRNDAGQGSVPAGVSNITAIAAGEYHNMALRNDGKVFVWGDNSFGQTNINPGLVPEMAIAAGAYHCLVLSSNGSVASWGDNTFQQRPPSGVFGASIAAGGLFSVVYNGNVQVFGNTNYAGAVLTNVPGGLTFNVAAIAAGADHCVVLKTDGTIAVWGDNTYGATNVPGGLNHVVALAQGSTASHVLVVPRHTFIPAGLADGTLTNLNASNISGGTLADARLSTNVALLNASQAFNGVETINGPLYLNGPLLMNSAVGFDQSSIGNFYIDAPFLPGGRFAITTSGNVGIGTNTPVSALHVSAAGDVEVSIDSKDPAGRRYTLQSSDDHSGVISSSFQIIDRTLGVARMIILTNGNVGIGSTPTVSPGQKLLVVNATCDGNIWINSSDRNLKENFAPVDGLNVLDRVAGLPIMRWNYKSDGAVQHLGPMAQDFHATFQLGADDKGIATLDESGVALAAIQGLNEERQKEEGRMRKLEQENAELKARLEKLERLIETKTGRAE